MARTVAGTIAACSINTSTGPTLVVVTTSAAIAERALTTVVETNQAIAIRAGPIAARLPFSAADSIAARSVAFLA